MGTIVEGLDIFKSKHPPQRLSRPRRHHSSLLFLQVNFAQTLISIVVSCRFETVETPALVQNSTEICHREASIVIRWWVWTRKEESTKVELPARLIKHSNGKSPKSLTALDPADLLFSCGTMRWLVQKETLREHLNDISDLVSKGMLFRKLVVDRTTRHENSTYSRILEVWVCDGL